jgi:hypothetical protein
MNKNMSKDMADRMSSAFQSDPSLPALLSGASSVSADPEGDFLCEPCPTVIGRPSVIDTTDSLTPPAFAKEPVTGFPLDAHDVPEGAVAVRLDGTSTHSSPGPREYKFPAAAIEHRRPSLQPRLNGPPRQHYPHHQHSHSYHASSFRRHSSDDEDDDASDSDSDEGLTMARRKKKPSPSGVVSPPSCMSSPGPGLKDAAAGVVQQHQQMDRLVVRGGARRRDTNVSVGSTETAKKIAIDGE